MAITKRGALIGLAALLLNTSAYAQTPDEEARYEWSRNAQDYTYHTELAKKKICETGSKQSLESFISTSKSPLNIRYCKDIKLVSDLVYRISRNTPAQMVIFDLESRYEPVVNDYIGGKSSILEDIPGIQESVYELIKSLKGTKTKIICRRNLSEIQEASKKEGPTLLCPINVEIEKNSYPTISVRDRAAELKSEAKYGKALRNGFSMETPEEETKKELNQKITEEKKKFSAVIDGQDVYQTKPR